MGMFAATSIVNPSGGDSESMISASSSLVSTLVMDWAALPIRD